eukprot:2623289-Pyramimonas_sp.AAC.1
MKVQTNTLPDIVSAPAGRGRRRPALLLLALVRAVDVGGVPPGPLLPGGPVVPAVLPHRVHRLARRVERVGRLARVGASEPTRTVLHLHGTDVDREGESTVQMTDRK